MNRVNHTSGRRNKVVKTIKQAEKQVRGLRVPIVTAVADRQHDPYLVLISCLLSLRTKDETTTRASARLFKVADNPRAMINLSEKRIQKLIYPVGFYRNKARVVREASRRIIDEYKGKVPDTEEGLLSLKGVGRKTATLVLGLGFNKPAICVDTHVHRISNRLGWVKTRSPEETEKALEKIVPRAWWVPLNTIFVTFGQNICVPISPFCSRCSIFGFCGRKGVARSR